MSMCCGRAVCVTAGILRSAAHDGDGRRAYRFSCVAQTDFGEQRDGPPASRQEGAAGARREALRTLCRSRLFRLRLRRDDVTLALKFPACLV